MSISSKVDGQIRVSPGRSGQGPAEIHGRHGTGVRKMSGQWEEEAGFLQTNVWNHPQAPWPFQQSRVRFTFLIKFL